MKNAAKWVALIFCIFAILPALFVLAAGDNQGDYKGSRLLLGVLNGLFLWWAIYLAFIG